MSPGILILSGFFWLGIFMLVGLIINKARGKPTVNGALQWPLHVQHWVFLLCSLFGLWNWWLGPLVLG